MESFKKFLGAFGMVAAMATMTVYAQENGESEDGYSKYRIGGYGEMRAAWKDYGNNRFYGSSEGSAKKNRGAISIPRFVIAGDYKFNSKWILGAEIEFESGGTGIAYEIENTENGEYETEVEKGGEVAIEQFHITRMIHPAFNVRVGHMVLPVGRNNKSHEPIFFFGTTRPEGETTIIPNTWHETGVEFFGEFGRGYGSFNYQLQVVEGLNANGFDRNNWAGGASQGVFEEDNFTSPAYVARLDYVGVPGLTLGGSFYYCKDAASNSDKQQTYNFVVPVRIFSADAQYINRYVTARCNFLWGNISNSSKLSSKNGKLSSASPYSRTAPIAHKAVSYGGEVGLNVKGIVGNDNCPVIFPFVRYEYYNSQEDVVAPLVADARLKTSMWTAGINWKPVPQIVVKADYTARKIGGGAYNSENEFAVAVAWTGWLASK